MGAVMAMDRTSSRCLSLAHKAGRRCDCLADPCGGTSEGVRHFVPSDSRANALNTPDACGETPQTDRRPAEAHGDADASGPAALAKARLRRDPERAAYNGVRPTTALRWPA